MVPEQRAEPHSAVLIIRAWVEPGATERVRARLLTGGPEDPSGGTQWAVAAGEAEICAAVGRWVSQLAEPRDSRDPREPGTSGERTDPMIGREHPPPSRPRWH